MSWLQNWLRSFDYKDGEKIIWCRREGRLHASPSAGGQCHSRNLAKTNNQLSELDLKFSWWFDNQMCTYWPNIVELCATRLSVDRTFIEFAVLARSCVDCVDVDHRHLLVQHLWQEHELLTSEMSVCLCTLGLLSTSLPVLRSREAPSRKSPCT